MLLSSCLVVSHIPFPQQDGFSLSFKGEENGLSYHRMGFVSLAGTLQTLVIKFTVFQIPRVAFSPRFIS